MLLKTSCSSAINRMYRLFIAILPLLAYMVMESSHYSSDSSLRSHTNVLMYIITELSAAAWGSMSQHG